MNFKLVRVISEILKDYRACMEGFPGGGHNFKGGHTPSTGLMAFLLLRRECQKLRVYGFGQVRARGCNRP
eukprot:356129-Prorocentrum_minimum.AAC.1